MQNIQRLVVVIMGEKCLPQLELAVKSAIGADAIVFLDGAQEIEMGGLDNRSEEEIFLKNNYNFNWVNYQGFVSAENNRIYINEPYDHISKEANGRQRNKYLKFIQKHFPDWWCLAIDADEAISDIKKLKQDIQTLKEGIYHPNMEHVINDFIHVDATVSSHYCLARLFKIKQEQFYPEVEHPVLNAPSSICYGNYDGITLWHFAYGLKVFDIKRRYENHLAKSNMHTPEGLKNWYLRHQMGVYPTKEIALECYPPFILNYFKMQDAAEIMYFARRMEPELKHFYDAIHWKEYFKPKKVMDIGAGVGIRMFCMYQIGLNVQGIEISRWAINNSPYQPIKNKIWCLDISLPDLNMPKNEFDLVTCYDVLEHMKDKEALNRAIDNIWNMANKYVLISVPTLGDPNLDLDKTHCIRESILWWKNQLAEKGFIIEEVPNHFLYKQQLILCKKPVIN